jgi:hypothetical protein
VGAYIAVFDKKNPNEIIARLVRLQLAMGREIFYRF